MLFFLIHMIRYNKLRKLKTAPRPPVTSHSTCLVSRVILRDSHHRAVSSPGEQCGGSAHRDVSGRRLRAPCGGHHRGLAGQQGFARYHQRTAEQKSLRSHRGLAQPSVTGRALSIRLRGRHLPAPQMKMVFVRFWALSRE